MPPLSNAVVPIVLGLIGTLIGPPDDPASEQVGSIPLPTAHAHNDYRHADPCIGALRLGFRSIEVDVFPVGDDLLVAHDLDEATPDRTIEGLYLEPLARWCETTPEETLPVTLLVDIKRDGPRALELLLEKLSPLRPLLSRVERGEIVAGRIMVILSGSRPIAEVAAMPDRVVFIDGRPADLARNPPVTLVPLVSGSYGPTLETPLFGPPSDSAGTRLRALARTAHEQGRRLRFWGHLEDPAIWAALVEAKVDLIGTDDRARLADWLLANDPRCRRPDDAVPMAETSDADR